MVEVTCPDCDTEQEISDFMVEVGEAFGLVGVACENCPETIPADVIQEAKQ